MYAQRFMNMRLIELVRHLAAVSGNDDIVAQCNELAKEVDQAPKSEENGG